MEASVDVFQGKPENAANCLGCYNYFRSMWESLNLNPEVAPAPPPETAGAYKSRKYSCAGFAGATKVCVEDFSKDMFL